MTGIHAPFLNHLVRTFRSGPLNRKIFRLATPVFFAMISHTLVMVSDTAMVGSLGSDSLAATGLAGSSFWTLLSFLFGGSMGVQIITARRAGEKHPRAARQALESAILVTILLGVVLLFPIYFFTDRWMSLLSGNPRVASLAADFFHIRLEGAPIFFLLFILTGFFDGLGRTRITMVSSMVLAGANVLFNWVFIYGHLGAPALGVRGAALSSNLAGAISMLVFILVLTWKEFRIYFPVEKGRRTVLRLDPVSIREILYISFPPGLEHLLINFAFLLFYRIAGEIGTVSVASTNIIVAVMSISFMPGFSFGIAATTLLGQSMGRGNSPWPDRASTGPLFSLL